MGKIKKGILGGFNGRVGNVIGASWKGIAYMRSEAQSIKDPKTQSQILQRTIFGVCSDWVSKNLALFNVGFQEQAVKKSAFNAAVKTNLLAEVFTDGSRGEPLFQSDKCVFSKGSFPGFVSVSVSTTDPSNLVASFEISNFEGDYRFIDAYFLLIDDVDYSKPIVFATESFNESLQASVSLPKPTGESGSIYQMFAFVCDKDAKKVCDSMLVGSYEIS